MRWPFAKKQEPKEESTSGMECDAARVSALRAWRDIGQEFDYLGRRMVVVKHSRIDVLLGDTFPAVRLVPEVHARYADDKGELHVLVMSESEALALAARSLPANVEFSGEGKRSLTGSGGPQG